ncbi:hypothetical protein LOY35_12585 [Pseudomonas sp. B21-028]|uniref:hypothetical protein n=1 Tax=Pseudomonas sp. B21-028 TaxID=2895480 RepID=UPI00215FEAC5|nr:hypothetical protein [Pseudomonas sp. B21-028]UVL86355.1 hypothetical protein LOY35_12585 [Pseudomonas sp. B21-028]
MDATAVQEPAFKLPSQSLIETALRAASLCAAPVPGVLPMSAAGFVAACQRPSPGGLGQFPGSQVKDFPGSCSP